MILLLLSSLGLPIYHKMYLDLWYHFRLRNMSTFNQTSSYNRTYERKVVEEAPRIRVTTQTHQPFSPVMIPASYFPSFHFAPTSLSSSGSPTTLGTGGTVTSLRTSSDSFQATLDVSLFAPEDLKVNIILHHRFWWSVLGVPIQVQIPIRRRVKLHFNYENIGKMNSEQPSSWPCNEMKEISTIVSQRPVINSTSF